MKLGVVLSLVLLAQISFAQDPDSTLEKAAERTVQFKQAFEATEKKDYPKAEEIFQSLLKEKHPLTEYVHFYYGKVLFDQKKYPEAKIQFEAIAKLSPNIKMSISSSYLLSLIAMEEKKFKEAESRLVKLEKRSRSEATYPETIYQLARAEKGLFNNARACKWLKKLYTSYPQFEKIQTWGPQLSTNQFEGKETGCRHDADDLKKRIKNLQWASLSEKAFSEIQSLKKELGESQKYEIDRLEASYHLHEGDTDQALKLLLPYYEKKKKDFNYLTNLASVSARAGEVQAAVGSYYDAYKLAAGNKKGRQMLYQAAFLSYQFQDYDGASRKFKEFIKKYPTSGLSRDAKWQLAWIQYLRGDFKGAHTAMSEMMKQAKKNRRVWRTFPQDRVSYWMAMSLFRMGKQDAAKPIFEKLAKDPLLGYYSIASQARLRKVQVQLPKLAPVYREQLRRIARFSVTESVYASDQDFYNPQYQDVPAIEPEEAKEVQEEDESEATLAEEIQKTEQDATGQTAEVAETDEEAGAEQTIDMIPQVKFSNPVLVQRFERARELISMGLTDWAKWDLYEIERKTSNKDYLKTLMSQYESVGNYHRSSYIAQVNFSSQRALHGVDGVRYLWNHAYPQAYKEFVNRAASQYKIPSELIWGIMRAESHYKQDVISPVGALGLMQVMPLTGSKVAEMISLKNFEARSLLTPETAVKVGGKYLQRLMVKFNNNPALTAAGYNAGPHRVKGWVANFGSLDMDEFIEHIPFLETRNYVKKVVTNFNAYAVLYDKRKDAFNMLSEPLGYRVTTPVPTKETWEDI